LVKWRHPLRWEKRRCMDNCRSFSVNNTSNSWPQQLFMPQSGCTLPNLSLIDLTSSFAVVGMFTSALRSSSCGFTTHECHHKSRRNLNKKNPQAPHIPPAIHILQGLCKTYAACLVLVLTMQQITILQYFDAVGWATGRASDLLSHAQMTPKHLLSSTVLPAVTPREKSASKTKRWK